MLSPPARFVHPPVARCLPPSGRIKMGSTTTIRRLLTTGIHVSRPKTWIDEALHFGYYSKWHLVTSIQKSVVHMDILPTLKLAQNPISPNKQPLLPKNGRWLQQTNREFDQRSCSLLGRFCGAERKDPTISQYEQGYKISWRVGRQWSKQPLLSYPLSCTTTLPTPFARRNTSNWPGTTHTCNFPQTSKTIAMGVLGFTQHLGEALWTPLPSTKKSGKLSSPIPTLTLPWSTKPSVLSSIDWMTLILLIQNYRFCRWSRWYGRRTQSF